MDVDSVAGRIHLTGSEHSLTLALAEIDKITMAVDEDVCVPIDILAYFTTKHVNVLSHFRERHPDLQVEAYREKGTISFRGLPETIARAKLDLLDLKLFSETRTLIGRESSFVVGKNGRTINRLVEKHQVTIDVSETEDEVFTATVSGPQNNIDAAILEINELLESNKEITDQIMVDSIVRNTLLTDSGAPIKGLQKECSEAIREIGGGIQLNFRKEDEKSFLVIKGRQAAVVIAKQMVSKRIGKIQASLVAIHVDPFIVPKVIGKGGETIKRIKNGKLVNIDVDKTSGRIVIQSQDNEEVTRVEIEINKIVAENQIERIQLLPSTGKAIFRELVRSSIRDEINSLVWMGFDDETSSIIIRGVRKNVDKIKLMVTDFITKNYIEDIEISAEDEPTLLAGGSESPIQKFQEEYGAELNVIRDRFVVIAKGPKINVKAAIMRLNQFLHGGDGNSVSRLTVTEQALGIVIGKNGNKRAHLEKKHEGVNLFIHRSNRITIRGPHEAVEACRIDILRLVSSVKIHQIMNLTPKEHETLSKNDSIRRVTHGIPVQVVLTDDAVKIRGFYTDVRDVLCLLKDLVSKVYEAQVELEATQLSCVRGACRDPSHFQQMQEATNAEVKLDLSNNSIVIIGKRGNVRKAKSLVIDFLQFLLPTDFAKFKISQPVQLIVGDAAILADCAAISGATVYLDRDLSSILIQSSIQDKVKSAINIIEKKIEQAEKLAFVVNFEASESWLIPFIIGKNGNRIKSLRLESGCNVDISKSDRRVTVTGDVEASVIKAREVLYKIIDDARRQCVFIELPDESMTAFLGHGGSHIRAFASENKVVVERMRKDQNVVKITGEEEHVAVAQRILQEWINLWMTREIGKTITIDRLSIPVVLRKQGSVIAAIEKEYSCKVEIDREKLTLTVCGSTEEVHDQAIGKINHIIAEEKGKTQLHQKPMNSFGHDFTVQAKVKLEESMNGIFQNRIGLAPKSNDSLSTYDSRKDRSSEFAKRPVGLTIVEKDASLPKNKRKNMNKYKPQDISDEQTLQVGSSAGRSLFNLLVSESKSNSEHHEKHGSSVSNNAGRVSLMVNEEQWDSSTVSSAAIDSSDPDDETGKHTEGAKPYIKSASGFTVRV